MKQWYSYIRETWFLYWDYNKSWQKCRIIRNRMRYWWRGNKTRKAMWKPYCKFFGHKWEWDDYVDDEVSVFVCRCGKERNKIFHGHYN